MSKWGEKVSTQLLLHVLCTNKGNNMNPFEGRLSKSVHRYPQDYCLSPFSIWSTKYTTAEESTKGEKSIRFDLIDYSK